MNNSIISSNTFPWPHQLLVCICLSERAYFNNLECSYNTWYVYNDRLSLWTRTKVIRRKHIVQPTGFGAYSHPASNGMERMCQRHESYYTPILLFQSENHYIINLYIATYTETEFWYKSFQNPKFCYH